MNALLGNQTAIAVSSISIYVHIIFALKFLFMCNYYLSLLLIIYSHNIINVKVIISCGDLYFLYICIYVSLIQKLIGEINILKQA